MATDPLSVIVKGPFATALTNQTNDNAQLFGKTAFSVFATIYNSLPKLKPDRFRSSSRHFFLALGLVLLGGALALVPNPSWAGTSSGATIDVSDGITTSGTGWNYDKGNHVFTITGSNTVTITGWTNTNRIVVPGGVKKTIVFNGVTIDMSVGNGDVSSFALNDANVNLLLQGGSTNTLKGGKHAPGLQVQKNSSITIDTWGTGTAKLLAAGGEGAAGIGGGRNAGVSTYGEDSGTITIAGGDITAIGGNSGGNRANPDNGGGGAGIGGGSPRGINGTITIRGGNIQATGGYPGGAGIGGGAYGGAISITIAGNANVTSTGGDALIPVYSVESSMHDGPGGGAGIGSGGFGALAGAITINTTGTVNAKGGWGRDFENHFNYYGRGAGVGLGGEGGAKGAGIESITPPAAVTVNTFGGTATFTLGATTQGRTTPNLEYYWETSLDNGATWKSAGTNSPSFSVSVTSASTRVRGTVKVYGGSMPNNSFILYTLYPKLSICQGTITITSQPKDMTVYEGAISGSLNATASTNSCAGPVAYQWYQEVPSGEISTGQKIAGATNPTFNIPAGLKAGTYYYYCEVSAPNAPTVKSSVAKVVVTHDISPKISPKLSALTVNKVTPTGVSFSVTSDITAIGHWLALPTGGLSKKITPQLIIASPYSGEMTGGKAFTGWIRDRSFSTEMKRIYTLYFIAVNGTAQSNIVSATFTAGGPSR